MSVAHSTDKTVGNCHAKFNRLAFGIDLDGNPLPSENGCVYRGLNIISSEKCEEIMGSTVMTILNTKKSQLQTVKL